MAGRDVRRGVPGHRPGRGFPAGPARAPGRVRGKGGPRARGCGSVRGGLGSASCRPPVLGRLGSSPARSRRPFHRGLLRVGVRVGLLVPKATEGLFKLDAGFAPAARSAVAETESWGLLASESIQRPVPVQPQVPKPRRCASTPTRLIELAPSGTSRDGRVTRVVRVSARHIGRCRVCSVRCRRVLSPTSPPQDGSGRRRALHMPNSVGSMCQTARGTKQWDLHALTGRRPATASGLRVVWSPCRHCAGVSTATCHKVQLWQSTIGLGRLQVAWRRGARTVRPRYPSPGAGLSARLSGVT